jgi:5-methylcytosine-specific restriction endonuclease McrA
VIGRQNHHCWQCQDPFNWVRPSEVHHVDHVRTNHASSNLMALCPNCHAAHHRNGLKLNEKLWYETWGPQDGARGELGDETS